MRGVVGAVVWLRSGWCKERQLAPKSKNRGKLNNSSDWEMKHLQTVFSGEGRKEALHGFMILRQSFTVVKRKQTADGQL